MTNEEQIAELRAAQVTARLLISRLETALGPSAAFPASIHLAQAKDSMRAMEQQIEAGARR